MAFPRVTVGVEEQNRLIDAGMAKANQVLFGNAKATTTDTGGFRQVQYGPGGVGVITPVSQETKNADALNAAQLATARYTNVKADVLPAESAATVNETAARAGLIGQQAKTIVPLANANIAQIGAQAALTNTTRDVLDYKSLQQVDPATTRAARESYFLSTLPEAQRPFYRLSDDGSSLVARTPRTDYPYALPTSGR